MKVILVIVFVIWFALISYLIYTVHSHSVGIHEGSIVEFRHEDAYVIVVPINIGKTTIMSPQYHPEKWSVIIKNKKNETNEFQITEREYSKYKIGEHLVFQKENNFWTYVILIFASFFPVGFLIFFGWLLR